MRLPEALSPLVDQGVLDDVVRPLMSGKEAMVYLVLSEGRECVAKVYKDAQHRSFKNKAEYTEGRRVRNTRDQRAMSKRTAYGRARDEAAWKSTEVDMIYRLTSAGVRVPEPYWFIEGVLLMELVTDAEGRPARRLGELEFTPEDAQLIFEVLLADVVRMLHAGVVHGDLSEFNVLMAADGPVIIDFPQAIDASGNQNARKLLMRDIDNLHRFAARFIRNWQAAPYAEELWSIYERGELTADTRLTGKYVRAHKSTRVGDVVDVIKDADRDEFMRRRNRGEPQGARGRRPHDSMARDNRGPQQHGGRPPERTQHQGGRPPQRMQQQQGPRPPQRGGQGNHGQRPNNDRRDQNPRQGDARGRQEPGRREQRPYEGGRRPDQRNGPPPRGPRR